MYAAHRDRVHEMGYRGRHRSGQPPDPGAGFWVSAGIAARLLGQHPWMCRREVSVKAAVSRLSARKVWRALGLPDVTDDEQVFTDGDVAALRSVSALVRGGVLDQRAALAMMEAFASTSRRLALWQTQVVAQSLEGRSSLTGTSVSAQEVATKLADIADDLEPLLIYTWRRQLAATVVGMASHFDSIPKHSSELRGDRVHD
ncbi:MAG: hypothetical protein ABI662_04305 [Dermatophilaceae bacterium]